MLTVETIKTFEDFQSLEPLWNTTLQKSDMDMLFLSFEWISCWWQHYGNKKSLFILLVKDEGKLVGIAPLMIQRYGFGPFSIRHVCTLTNDQVNRTEFIITENVERVIEHIIKYLRTRLGPFTIFTFKRLWEDSQTYRVLNKSLWQKEWLSMKKTDLLSPYITCDDSWEHYFKQRSRNVKNNYNKTRNKFAKLSSHEIVSYKYTNIEEGLKHMLAISKKTWKFKEGTAIASDSSDKGFYTALAKWASEKQWFQLYILKINEQPVAFQYAINYNNKKYCLKIGFDESYAEFSPNRFLIIDNVKDSFINKYKECDLLGHNEKFKMDLATACRTHYQFYFIPNKWLFRVFFPLACRLIKKFKNIEYSS